MFKALLTASICIFIVGVIDDSHFLHIQNKAKLLLEILIAVQTVLFFGIQFTQFDVFGYKLELGIFAVPISLLWIVGISNAVNIIDGIDGLAGSIVFTSFLAIGLVELTIGHFSIALVSIILCGSVAGFLLQNFSPARVFLGDTGSLFFGIILGILTIETVSPPHGNLTALMAPLLLGFPIIDLSAAMIRRFFKARFKGESLVNSLRSMTIADNDHIHHRLVFRGLSHAQACILLFAFHAGLCASGVIIALRRSKYSHDWIDWVLFGYLLVYIFFFLKSLHFFEYISVPLKKLSKEAVTKKPITVTVINTDQILEHSLQCYKQNVFNFLFVTPDQFLSLETEIALLIINSTDGSYYFDGLNSKDFSYPVIFLYDNPENMQRAAMLDSEKNVLHLKRPVYIPILIRAAYSMIKRQKIDFNALLSKTRIFKSKDLLVLTEGMRK